MTRRFAEAAEPISAVVAHLEAASWRLIDEVDIARLDRLIADWRERGEALRPFAEDGLGIAAEWSDARRRASLTSKKPLMVADFRRAAACMEDEG